MFNLFWNFGWYIVQFTQYYSVIHFFPSIFISPCYVPSPVSVPSDAYMMDFVFSESEEGGIYDNRNGMDYHIPVTDSIAKEPPMHIVHIAVEMAPIAKVKTPFTNSFGAQKVLRY